MPSIGGVILDGNDRLHTADALAKYEEALKYAPHWKQLTEARETMAKVRS